MVTIMLIGEQFKCVKEFFVDNVVITPGTRWVINRLYEGGDIDMRNKSLASLIHISHRQFCECFRRQA